MRNQQVPSLGCVAATKWLRSYRRVFGANVRATRGKPRESQRLVNTMAALILVRARINRCESGATRARARRRRSLRETKTCPRLRERERQWCGERRLARARALAATISRIHCGRIRQVGHWIVRRRAWRGERLFLCVCVRVRTQARAFANVSAIRKRKTHLGSIVAQAL